MYKRSWGCQCRVHEDLAVVEEPRVEQFDVVAAQTISDPTHHASKNQGAIYCPQRAALFDSSVCLQLWPGRQENA